MKLILASSSTARLRLLKSLKIPFESISPDIDETELPGENAFELTCRLARQKAQKVANSLTVPALILGCDQLGTLEHQFLGKPMDHHRAVKMLQAQRNKTITYTTSLCVLNNQTQEHQTITETFDVKYRNYSDQDIELYLKKEQPYHCAGGLKIEGLGITLVEKLSGSDPNTLIGIPMIKLTELLRQNNFPLYD